MEKNWSHFRDRRILQDSEACRTILATNDLGERILIYEVTYKVDTAAAVRIRLEYETAQLTQLSSDRMTIPLDFEFGEECGKVLCPHIDGQSLEARIKGSRLQLTEVMDVAEDLLAALTDLHDHSMVRRCLSPDEIYVHESDGRLRAILGGYGPLLILQGLQNPEAAARFATYASPEALGAMEEDVRAAADLYSLGILMFECLTGRPPFEGATAGDLVFHHMTSRVQDLTTLAPDIPPALSDIVKRLLEKHPRDRYQSAEGVLFDLRQVRESLSSGFPHRLVLGTMDHRDTLIEPAFVGRADEMQLLNAELKSVRGGKNRTVLVSGASGLGKSRLLLEVSRAAAADGFWILRTSGQNQIGHAPVAPLRTILSQTLELIRLDADLRESLRTELRDFGREIAAVAPGIVAVLELPVPENAVDLSDRRIAVALATLLGSLWSDNRPMLLMLDDMHWADDLTLTMLECWHLINSGRTMLVIGTRPAECAADRLLNDLACSARISLAPLERESHDQLLESMAGGLPPEIMDTVWEMSSGNPFAASAVLRGLVESEVLASSNSGWQVNEGELKNLQMSGKAAELLKRRLVRLPGESQHLLAVGAVLGKEFSIGMASELAGIAQSHGVKMLDEPRKNCLVWERASGSLCVFMHDQIREAILATLSPVRRAEIHGRAAIYMAHHEPDQIFQIALHYDAAGRHDLAKDIAIEAAERARLSHALEAAEQQYRIALRSCSALRVEPDFRVLFGLGDVLMLSGRYLEAEPLFERAIRCADSTLTWAQVTVKLGELAFKEDRKDRAIELWESALVSLGGKLPSRWQLPFSTIREIVVQTVHTFFPKQFVGQLSTPPAQEDQLIWKICSRLAYAYWFVRSKQEVLCSHLRGMNLAERYLPTAELAQAYAEHAPAMSLIPMSRRGISYARKSLRIRTDQNDIWGQGQSMHCLAIALYCAANYEECIDVGQRSVRILERAGDFWEKHTAQYQVAASLYRLGRFTEAVQLAREGYDSGLAVGDFQACGNMIDIWARASNGCIPPEILQCELDRSRADVQGRALVLLARGVSLISEQHHEEAAGVLDQGIRLTRDAGVANTYTASLYAWKATALRSHLENCSQLTRRRRKAVIRAHYRAARKAVFVALRFGNDRPHALREFAWANVFGNSNRRAVLLLRQSIKTARRHSAEYELIQSDLLLQRLLLELGTPDSVQALERAQRRLSGFNSDQLPQRMLSSVSLVDRFDLLLESGRRIAAANDPAIILETAVDAARRLLRSKHCETVGIEANGQPATTNEAIRSGVLSAVRSRDAVSSNSGSDFRSLLNCPIIVRGKVTACLVVGNSEVRDLFGPNELRIARYITAIAGAALENAAGFSSLQELNANLEKIVEERTAVVEARSSQLMETTDDLRKAQVQLAAARDAAETASRAKSTFLAHMSHEIRTPISAVLGFTELLLNGDAPLVPEQTAYLQRVLSNGNHLHRLLNDLLDLSRIEAGRLTIECIETEPASLIFEVLSALQSRAIDKQLKLSLRVLDRIPEKISTDPTRLRQILTNLIGNAIKFTAEGSVNLLVNTDVDAQRIHIQVQDTGPGIPLEAQRDVFESFKQADVSVVRNFGGTGLGLPISRQLAQALGGDIELASEPGYGSTFTVTIATGSLDGVRLLTNAEAESSLTASRSLASVSVDLTGCRILIVDDVEANRELFSMVLKRAHAECCVAENGQEALDAVDRKPIDLVLMDMQMPVMDGYTATRVLRSRGVNIPIVAITANGMEEDRVCCQEVGCSGYLTKPISMANLLSGVAAAVGRSICESVVPNSTGALQESDSASAQATPSPENRTTPRRSVSLPTDPVFRDFAIRFLAKIESSLPQLQSAIVARDAKRIMDLGHWIKGTGGTVGMMELTNMGIELQSFGREQDFAKANDFLAELTSVVNTLMAEAQPS